MPDQPDPLAEIIRQAVERCWSEREITGSTFIAEHLRAVPPADLLRAFGWDVREAAFFQYHAYWRVFADAPNRDAGEQPCLVVVLPDPEATDG